MWALLIFGSAMLLITGIGWYFSVPGYTGPVSDHFDGSRFSNPGNVPTKSGVDILKWMITRDPGKWSELTEEEVEYGSKPEIRIADSVVITYVNHSTFIIQTDSLNILTDPIWADRTSPFSFAGPKRMRPPGIRFEDLPPIDVVLLSHNHYDHLDLQTLSKLNRRFEPLFITPLGLDLYLNSKGIIRTQSLDWWEQHSVSETLTVDCVPAQHFSARGMFDRNKTLWGGFVLKTTSGNIYFAGDTGYGNFFTEIGDRYAPIEMALIPIGAYIPRWFMAPAHVNPAEAIQVHKDVKAKQSIGMHYGTFPLADDSQYQPVRDFKEARNDENFILLKEGKKVTIGSGNNTPE